MSETREVGGRRPEVGGWTVSVERLYQLEKRVRRVTRFLIYAGVAGGMMALGHATGRIASHQRLTEAHAVLDHRAQSLERSEQAFRQLQLDWATALQRPVEAKIQLRIEGETLDADSCPWPPLAPTPAGEGNVDLPPPVLSQEYRASGAEPPCGCYEPDGNGGWIRRVEPPSDLVEPMLREPPDDQTI